MRCILQKEREIREVRYSPKGRGNKGITFIKTNSKQRRPWNKRSYIQGNEVELKALFPSKRTGNRYVIFDNNEREIREVIFTKTKGK